MFLICMMVSSYYRQRACVWKVRVCARGFSEGKSEASKRKLSLWFGTKVSIFYTRCYVFVVFSVSLNSDVISFLFQSLSRFRNFLDSVNFFSSDWVINSARVFSTFSSVFHKLLNSANELKSPMRFLFRIWVGFGAIHLGFCFVKPRFF